MTRPFASPYSVQIARQHVAVVHRPLRICLLLYSYSFDATNGVLGVAVLFSSRSCDNLVMCSLRVFGAALCEPTGTPATPGRKSENESRARLCENRGVGLRKFVGCSHFVNTAVEYSTPLTATVGWLSVRCHSLHTISAGLGVRAGRPGVRILVVARDFSVLQHVRTDPRAHPAFYSMGTWSHLGDKG